MINENVFSIIEKIKTGDATTVQEVWRNTIPNRVMAIEVLKLLDPLARKKLTEDLRA